MFELIFGTWFQFAIGGLAPSSLQHQHPPAHQAPQPKPVEPASKPAPKPEPIAAAKQPGRLAPKPEAQHGQHAAGHGAKQEGSAHEGTMGPWPMSREGSGTSWLPDSSPHYAMQLPKCGLYELTLMGFATGNWVDAGGKRGDEQLFSNSMAMLVAYRKTGDARIAFRGMFSLDAVFNGQRGYPVLFQTGETAHGEPLVDRQHPHDLLSELAFSAGKPIGRGVDGVLYLALIGEPAIGGTAFVHRPSTFDNPEAPIGHHWFDGTHITYGVVTAGAVFDDRWKLEASAFKGREPNEDRFDVDPIKLDSYSGRISLNASPDWSFQASYATLKEPEATEPGVDQRRFTASAHFNRRLADGGNFAAALIYGRNMKDGDEPGTDAIGLEGAYRRRDTTYFARWENVEKDELVGVPEGVYRINKFSVGFVKELSNSEGFETGFGAYLDFHSFPGSLEPFYGSNPVTIGVFLRVRPRSASGSNAGHEHH